MYKIGIIGGAGYTAGELIRLLLKSMHLLLRLRISLLLLLRLRMRLLLVSMVSLQTSRMLRLFTLSVVFV